MGGAAALATLGVSAYEDALAFNLLSGVANTPAAVVETWGTWSQESEAQIVSSTLYVAMMEDADAADAVGQGGGLTGADLVLSLIGNAPLTAGPPPYRTFDGTNDNMTMTENWADTLLTGGIWSVFMRMNNYAGVSGSRLLDCTGLGDEHIRPKDALGKLKLDLKSSGQAGEDSQSTVNDIPATDIIIGCWADSVEKVRGGFVATSAGTPTKWSDFAANDRVEAAADMGLINAGDFDDGRALLANAWNGQRTACDLYWLVVSKGVCLIDNAS